MAEAIALSIDTVAAADTVAADTVPADTVAANTGPPPTPPGPVGTMRLCREVRSVVSLLSPDGVSRQLLYLGGSADVFAASPDDLDDALGGLASASLLGFTRAAPTNPDASAADATAADASAAGASTVTVHRLVMRVARERAADDGTLPDLAVKATALLHAYIRSVGEPWQNRPAARDFLRQASALTASVVPDPRAADGEGLLNLRSWAVWCANELADTPSEAVDLAEQLAADNERVRGPSHPDTRVTLSHLATAYKAAGRVREAVSLFERVLAECERQLGRSDPDTMRTQHNLAEAYLEAGRAADAVPLLERVPAEPEPGIGQSGPELLAIQHSLASAYRAVGRVADAQSLFERCWRGGGTAGSRSRPLRSG